MNTIGSCVLGFLGKRGSETAPSINYPTLGEPRAMSTFYPDTTDYNEVFKYLHKEIRKQYDSPGSGNARKANPKIRRRK